jgi:tRNA uridine 5-carboxymethylaminomethyl modification enzyme
MLASHGLPTLAASTSLDAYLKRPEITASALQAAGLVSPDLDARVARCLEIEIKYEGYVAREENLAHRLKELDRVWIPAGFDYGAVSGLSREVQEKLRRHAPSTLGQASRISGITPAAVTLLQVMLRRAREAVAQG